jgi:hypothetical protein
MVKTGNDVLLEFDIKDNGTYQFNVRINNSNYTLNTTSKIVNISKAPLSITFNGTDAVYNGIGQTVTVEVNGFLNKEEDTINTSAFTMEFLGNNQAITPTITRTLGSIRFAFNVIDAGTYTFKVTSISGNYTLVSYEKTIIITPKTLETDVVNGTYIYSGLNQGPVLSIRGIETKDINTFMDFLSCVNCSIQKTEIDNGILFLYFQGKNVGTYESTLSSRVNLKNYVFETENIAFDIDLKPITATWTNDTSFVYTGTTRTVTLRLTGIAENEISALAISAFISSRPITRMVKTGNDVLLEFDIKDNGTYQFNVRINNSNYTLNTTSREIVISPKAITATWTNDTSFVYTGSNSTVTLRLSGIAENDLSAITTSAFTTSRPITRMVKTDNDVLLEFDIKDNGTYQFNVRINNSNYTLNTTSDTVVISPKPITATWTTSTGQIMDIFDGVDKKITLTIEGLVLGEDVSEYVELNVDIDSVINNFDGKISIIISVLDANEYNFIANYIGTNYSLETSSFTYTINKRVLNVSFEGPLTLVYDGEEKTRIVKISNMLLKDLNAVSIGTLNFQLSGNASIDVSKLDNELVISFTGIEIGEYFLRSFNLLQNDNYETVELNEIFSIGEDENPAQ